MDEWRDIPGYDGRYQITKEGRAKSVARIVRMGNKHRGEIHLADRIMVPRIRSSSTTVSLTKPRGSGKKGSITHRASVARLVLSAFDREERFMVAWHIDADLENNHLDNLKWGTRLENVQDKIRHGTVANFKGEFNPRAKLTERDVKLIIYQVRTGLITQKELGKIYNISFSVINDIVHQKSWKHLWQVI